MLIKKTRKKKKNKKELRYEKLLSNFQIYLASNFFRVEDKPMFEVLEDGYVKVHPYPCKIEYIGKIDNKNGICSSLRHHLNINLKQLKFDMKHANVFNLIHTKGIIQAISTLMSMKLALNEYEGRHYEIYQ